ncbi:hypothetical protein FHS42_000356 [Streptomyces zagrosensis]|uniref:Uncharacterized protein n=1 Tax=Streptomyces zagrosensis TaxID=1042984 RepID=A0A7W9Q489_9ACTN|nr:hypothetical protein [Streptomyces zagrosensis]
MPGAGCRVPGRREQRASQRVAPPAVRRSLGLPDEADEAGMADEAGHGASSERSRTGLRVVAEGGRGGGVRRRV